MNNNATSIHRTTSKFKPETAAMVLIDQQVGTAGLVRTIDSKVAIQNAAILAKTALVLGMPLIVSSSQEENFQGPVSTVIQEAAPEAYARGVKRQGIVDAWEDPHFRSAVEATNRNGGSGRDSDCNDHRYRGTCAELGEPSWS